MTLSNMASVSAPLVPPRLWLHQSVLLIFYLLTLLITLPLQPTYILPLLAILPIHFLVLHTLTLSHAPHPQALTFLRRRMHFAAIFGTEVQEFLLILILFVFIVLFVLLSRRPGDDLRNSLLPLALKIGGLFASLRDHTKLTSGDAYISLVIICACTTVETLTAWFLTRGNKLPLTIREFSGEDHEAGTDSEAVAVPLRIDDVLAFAMVGSLGILIAKQMSKALLAVLSPKSSIEMGFSTSQIAVFEMFGFAFIVLGQALVALAVAERDVLGMRSNVFVTILLVWILQLVVAIVVVDYVCTGLFGDIFVRGPQFPTKYDLGFEKIGIGLVIVMMLLTAFSVRMRYIRLIAVECEGTAVTRY